MTTIIAIRDTYKFKLVMACDKRAHWDDYHCDGERKFFQYGECLMAMAGLSTFQDYIQSVLRNYEKDYRDDFSNADEKVLVDINTLLRELVLKKYNFDMKEFSEKKEENGSRLMLLNKNGIFLLHMEGSVGKVGDYWAEGSGAGIALGALHALNGMDYNTKSIAEDALKAAAAHDCYTGEGIEIQELEYDCEEKRKEKERLNF